MDTTKFEAELQNYLRTADANDRITSGMTDEQRDYVAAIDWAAYRALEEAAGLLGVSMQVQR